MYKAALFFALFGAASAGLAPAAVGYSAAIAQPTVLQAAPQIAYQQPLLRAPLAVAPQPILRAAPAPLAVAPQPILRAAPVLAKAAVAEPFDPNPQYNYGYSVSDSLTGDSKTATESRNGDYVQGEYSLVEPDGSLRIVRYTADPINGFNAVVDRQPAAVKAVAAPVAVAQPAVAIRAAPVAPVAYAQPARIAAPLTYAQPIAQPLLRSAPIAVARQAVAPAVVSTSFGSPFASYAY